MDSLAEPLENLFANSKILILDFSEIRADTPAEENIRLFFEETKRIGQNPRLPKNRQKFNDRMLAKTNSRYLVSRYGEDRIAMLADTPAGNEGRTIHMGIDIFARELEPVFSPCSGRIVMRGYEEGFGEYGNYLILQPESKAYYLFFGHLSSKSLREGPVQRGQIIAHLGDYANNENGGWSRHLHLQVLKKLPAKNKTPAGYSSHPDFEKNSQLFPNPMQYFPKWQL